MLLRAKQRDRAALSALCAVYWEPVYGFVRSYGVSRDLALDVTQGVFANLLKRDLRTLDLERGSRFRSWLKRVAQSHLLNVLKKGRRVSGVEVSDEREEVASDGSLPALDTRQDRLFDQRTALVVIERAWERLRRERYADDPVLFEHNKRRLSAEETELSDTELSSSLGRCDCYVRVVRQRVKDTEFPKAMRDELLRVGVSERRLNEELRALCEALGE